MTSRAVRSFHCVGMACANAHPTGEAMAGDASIPFVIPAGAKVLAGNYSGVMFDGDAACLRPFEALALAW